MQIDRCSTSLIKREASWFQGLQDLFGSIPWTYDCVHATEISNWNVAVYIAHSMDYIYYVVHLSSWLLLGKLFVLVWSHSLQAVQHSQTQTPLQPSIEERGSSEYSIFLYLHISGHNLIGWCVNYLTWTGLPYHNHLALLITPLHIHSNS